jgi:hypothetical protein
MAHEALARLTKLCTFGPNKARVRDGDPIPGELSRHVVAHSATVAHFSQENALLALMLVTSILREMHEWCEEVRSMDAPCE